MKSIQEIVAGSEYDFLRINEHLKGRLIFLAFGGSHSYGTATPASDVDIRGCAFNSKQDILGFGNFEQVIDNPTDTTIYSFTKTVRLMCECNPNLIELVGCKPEHIMIFDPVAQELLDNKRMFLSRRVMYSFGGYRA